MPRGLLVLTAIMITLVSGCSNSPGPIVGKWRDEGDEGDQITAEFRDDGTMSAQGGSLGCIGTFKAEKQQRTYRAILDCGTSRGASTCIVSSDGKHLTVTTPDGRRGDYTRVPD
ncbi:MULTISPECIES: hypothetical protein [Actinomadura]|uniref:Uncharacterized protein n=1 Tax=Actinomadura litoris TaxID=2678616 RepID=A0A7K1KVP2_9ACTN|nr:MULTISPECIES: hypothetical protein [Actinomadura]MBT2211188.1 hypothetical protein [Actinomadura sp. NEAU-AAG7]MUN36105.1 hypothetical protein [Actinomadura litoris]